MNSFGVSQFDEFLKFAGLFVLNLTIRGDLTSIRPRTHEFWGWSETNRVLFNLNEHFLQPNHMTMKFFLELFKNRDFFFDYFLWKKADQTLSPPLPTFIRYIHQNDSPPSFLIFVKNPKDFWGIPLPLSEKRFIYQAIHLPGFIHNINGPLGTITGRIELLSYKYPQIEEFEEVIRVGYRLQSIIDNLSFKIINEKHVAPTKIHLNRLLREEVSFLNCDLFFKHQVEKINEHQENIPEFELPYFSLSGVFQELYQFFRQFVDEHQEYLFVSKTFSQAGQVGFSVEFSGAFHEQGTAGATLPVHLEGDFQEILRHHIPGLDGRFLSHCLSINNGILKVEGNPEILKYHFEFPLPISGTATE